VKNLNAEGYKAPEYIIENVGDVMLDASLMFAERARWPSEVPESLQGKPFVLCTLHRQESTDSPEVFKSLIGALKKMSETMPVVWPVHPRAKKKMAELGITTDGLITTSPLGYLEMLALLKSCKLVATDSGGLQKEAYFFQKPCLTLRSETEWVELVEIGANVVCGKDPEAILAQFERAQKTPNFEPYLSLYGDETSAKRIATTLLVNVEP
jgi:UDP-GlcNAc3NAcA epimerase